jgi:regulatory protein
VKITRISQQAKQHNRYSIYVDSLYSFSLSESALLASSLVSGRELTVADVTAYKATSIDDKLYGRALRYVAMRPRSTWEIEFYMTRKEATTEMIKLTVTKLTDIGLLDDRKFATSFVHDRQLLRPTSKRKLSLELRKKHIASDIIDEVLRESVSSDGTALQEIVDRKRLQTKYQDDLKLMQYLARQGFSYGDIKSALRQDDEY